MITYDFTLNIGYSQAQQQDVVTVKEMGYTDEEWRKLTPDKKEKVLNETWQDWANNFIDGGWAEI